MRKRIFIIAERVPFISDNKVPEEYSWRRSAAKWTKLQEVYGDGDMIR